MSRFSPKASRRAAVVYIEWSASPDWSLTCGSAPCSISHSAASAGISWVAIA